MSSFTTPLRGEYNDVMTLFTLTEPFEFYDVAGKTYSVPVGFTTDFASIPKWLRWLIPPTGLYGKAAVLHDWLYRTGIVSRRRADFIFLRAMRVLGVPKWKRRAMYRAVRAFGQKYYQNQRG